MCSTNVALPSVYRSKRVMRVYHCLILQACNSPKWLCKHSENFKYHIYVSRFFTHGAIFSEIVIKLDYILALLIDKTQKIFQLKFIFKKQSNFIVAHVVLL